MLAFKVVNVGDKSYSVVFSLGEDEKISLIFSPAESLKHQPGYPPNPTHWVNDPADCLKRATRYSNHPTAYTPKAVHSAKRGVR